MYQRNQVDSDTKQICMILEKKKSRVLNSQNQNTDIKININKNKMNLTNFVLCLMHKYTTYGYTHLPICSIT